jgi:hypothetical protein
LQRTFKTPIAKMADALAVLLGSVAAHFLDAAIVILFSEMGAIGHKEHLVTIQISTHKAVTSYSGCDQLRRRSIFFFVGAKPLNFGSLQIYSLVALASKVLTVTMPRNWKSVMDL